MMLLSWLPLMNRHSRDSKSAPAFRRRLRSSRPAVEQLEDRCLMTADAVLTWNSYLLQAEANDFTPSIVATPDQPGPTGASRAFAIVQAAVYDAVNSIDGSYTPYLSMIPDAHGASIDAAVGQAAHDTLVQMFPHQAAMFNEELQDFLAGIPDASAKWHGIAVGSIAANNIMVARGSDGSQAQQVYTPYPYPGYWQPDPLHPSQTGLHPQWGEVRPFVLGSSNQFRSSNRVGTTPASRLDFLNSQEYTDAYNQVYDLGSATSPDRTADQTQIAIFWGYDGVPELGTPPREYNQITQIIATEEGNTEVQNARLFALVNLAMADAGIACWESKYIYNMWRPITGIRNADETGNPNTVQDPNWVPLGAQADNGSGSNFTPPFPSYDSGHGTFGAALFQTIRDFYGTDDIAFSWQSDEFNGITRDANGNVRPPATRSYDNLSQAQFENFISRVYLGVHWIFDQTEANTMGTSVGDYVFNNALRPVHGHHDGDVTVPVTPDAALGSLATVSPSTVSPVNTFTAGARFSDSIAGSLAALSATGSQQSTSNFGVDDFAAITPTIASADHDGGSVDLSPLTQTITLS